MAIKFNSDTSDYILLNNSGPLNIHSGNATGLTIELWVYVLGKGWNQSFIKREDWGIGGYQVKINDLNYLAFVTDSPNGLYLWAWGTEITINTWHHIACTVNTSSQGKIILDGNVISSASLGMPSAIDTIAAIGSSDGTWEFCKAIMDEFRIWNVERTLQQIKANMYRRILPQTNLKALWRCDEGKIGQGPSEYTLVDLSSNAVHGSVGGAISNASYVPGAPMLWNTGD